MEIANIDATNILFVRDNRGSSDDRVITTIVYYTFVW